MKTIFISLFTGAVNNLSRSEGVLEKLIKEKRSDTRLIFLSNEGYKSQLEPFLSDSVIYECIRSTKNDGREKLISKLFRFFYSFLIFTGTTKILATFGARADIPPAGGNRHLAPIKALIANTFGRSKFIKRKFVPWAYKKIYNDRAYAYLFEKYNPDLIFLPNVAFLPDQELAAEAQRRRIKTVGMAMNWDHLNKYYIPIHVDHLIAQNDPMRKEAVELHEYDQDQVFVTGFPQFDMHFNYKKYILPKDIFFKKFNISTDRKIIYFISGAAYSLDEPDILETISKWIATDKFAQKAHILLRPYVVLRDRAHEEKKYSSLLNDPNISFNWTTAKDEEFLRIYLSAYYYADAIISIFSTTAIEASLFNKPVLTIGFDGYKNRPYHESIRRLEDMSHFKHVLETDSVKVVRNFEDLHRSLANYLNDPKLDEDKRKQLVAKMCYKEDGKASERVANFVLNKVHG